VKVIRQAKAAGQHIMEDFVQRCQPYTINTYFNRPGNGCNMHYSQDRTLSQREVARLQTFPDSFEFKGSLTAINNQIGNAVPALLAYQIAK
jgi:DNA (cytosine-5)-methyltransferase 1